MVEVTIDCNGVKLSARLTRKSVETLQLVPELPVYAGCPRPLVGKPLAAERSHGSSGLGDLVLPAPAQPPRAEHGVFYLIDRLRRAAPKSLTVCALGPLTNIAAALVLAPEIALGVRELVLMGGATRGEGNVTAVAEFNIHADPHAASVVFESGLPITMVPLEITQTVRSTEERIAPIRALGTRSGAAAAELLGPRRALGQPPMAMHDPCVIAYLVMQELFQGHDAHVAIETQSPLAMGMTIIDRRQNSGKKPNALVIEAVDADGVYRLLAERLARLP